MGTGLIELDELKKLIDYVQMVYSEITEEWNHTPRTRVNLKKTQVCEVDPDGAIYRAIMEYIQLLNEKSPSITLQLSLVCACQVTARVKAQNSVEYKIQNYKTDRHEFGKIAVNKCINDLFGVRIILEHPLSFEQVHEFVKEIYRQKYRCIDSSKLEYRAVHLYFKQDNYSFPWELQIWNKCDMESNFASHKKYKQGYTTWEKESKEGGIMNA